MQRISHINNTSFERISEEAHGDVISCLLNNTDQFDDFGLDLLFSESFLADIPVAGVCDYAKFTGKLKPISNKISNFI